MSSQTTTKQARKLQSEERRARFRALAQRVGSMSAEERADVVGRAGVVTIAGHPLSPVNTCLCIHQRNAVSVVGGFRQWLAAGRAVQKGERGMMIWVPIGRKAKQDDGTEFTDEKTGFICGTVFDISQTAPIGDGAAAEAASPELASV